MGGQKNHSAITQPKLMTADSCKTYVPVYQTTRRHIPEHYLRGKRPEKVKSHIITLFFSVNNIKSIKTPGGKIQFLR